MLKINHEFSKLGLSLGAALLLSGAAGSIAHANPFPTSSDEARPPAAKAIALRPTAVTDPPIGAISSSDEARVFAGRTLPISSISATASTIVTSTDEARAAAGGGLPVPFEIERPEGSHPVASTVERN